MELESIESVLMRRDKYTRTFARELIAEAKQRIRDGEDPEEVLYEEFGLEPDYIFELL